MIRIGPAGIGGIKEAVERMGVYNKLGIKAAEIPFTYGVFMKEDKHKEEIKQIKKASKKNDIKLSIHAPYWINLNSEEEKKIEESKKRILDSCKIGHLIGARRIIFHPGFYGKREREKSYDNIKKAVLDMIKIIKRNGWQVKLCPETTGKVNVFGKEEEILGLVKETGCSFCIDFSHLLARSQGKISYKEMYDKVKNFQKLHCHFSGIEWGEKGERKHIPTPESEIKKLISILPKSGKDITIISEAPDPIKDAVRMLKELKKN